MPGKRVVLQVTRYLEKVAWGKGRKPKCCFQEKLVAVVRVFYVREGERQDSEETTQSD